MIETSFSPTLTFKTDLDLPIAAVLFDLDGTLAATADLWRQAESNLLSSFGYAWSAELARSYTGMNVSDVATTIHQTLQISDSPEKCRQTLREQLFKAFADAPPPPMPGALECVKRLANLAPLALASGSPLPIIESVVRHLKLDSYFDHLVSSESVKRGKPYPDVFLAAAEQLGASPERCLVIEDSLVGVQAAKAAGMKCFAIPLVQPPDFFQAADGVFRSLEEITLEKLCETFGGKSA